MASNNFIQFLSNAFTLWLKFGAADFLILTFKMQTPCKV